MVTGLLSPESPLNVNCDMALLSAQPEMLDDRQSEALGDLRMIFQCFSKVLCTFSAKATTAVLVSLVGDIQARQRPHILWIAVNNSSSTSGQIGMKTVPKWPQLHS